VKFKEVEAEMEVVRNFFRFQQFGDLLKGRYLGTREDASGKFGPQVVADIETADGIFSIPLNASLRPKLAKVKTGMDIRVTYAEDKPNDGVDRQGRPLSPTKMFRVEVSEDPPAPRRPTAVAPPAQAAAAPVNEDDIPF
jgi:hypothetical protein